MPTVKDETFSFGGVDSRSNPTNYPTSRALRSINWSPLSSGALRLREGYTVPSGGTEDSVPIHSAVYYEQFAATYLGAQYVLYGKSTQIRQVALSTGLDSLIGTFTSSNPWGHFRSNNRIFVADGISNYNWDGTTLRVTGIPPPTIIVSTPPSAYASSCTSGPFFFHPINEWVNPSNAEGPPDNIYTTATSTSDGVSTTDLYFKGFGFAIPDGSVITGMRISMRGHVLQGGSPAPNSVLAELFTTQGYFGVMYFSDSAIDSTVSIGGPTASDVAMGITPAVANDPNFGFTFVGIKNISLLTQADWSIDSGELTIWYTAITGALVSVTSSSLGSIAPNQLSGYQLYAAIYNPITQHMGNRAPIGERQTVSNTLSAFLLTGLVPLSTLDAEWQYALGMTNDGGEVPYWFIDPQGNNIVLGNDATMGTVYLGSVNPLQELPALNDVPLPMDKFARVGTRIFGAKAGDAFLKYSNDEADVSNADYVGKPEESWPPNQQEPLPDGGLPTSIHSYRLEGWFFSRENLCIWSQFMLQQGANPWRGPWPGGCAGQRAFIETPYGPYWISPQKQLCTFMEDGVISVSDEYEASLLAKISDSNIGVTELAYLRDQQKLIDEIVIKGLDSDGNPVIIIHDFQLKEARSPHGQGYQYAYVNTSPNTFVGSGYTPRQNVYDTTGRMRLWAGCEGGRFAQLEDGISDNGTTFRGDRIGMIGLGTTRRSLVELEYQGDPNLEISYLPDYSLTKDDFISVQQDPIGDDVQTQTRFGAKLGEEECRWVYVRLQLESQLTDASYAISDPPFLPMPSYGLVNEATLKLGKERPEGR